MADRYNEMKAVLPTRYVKFKKTYRGWEGGLCNDRGLCPMGQSSLE
jgi:hypothetical protein